MLHITLSERTKNANSTKMAKFSAKAFSWKVAQTAHGKSELNLAEMAENRKKFQPFKHRKLESEIVKLDLMLW